jgi:hypothetical protein
MSKELFAYASNIGANADGEDASSLLEEAFSSSDLECGFRPWYASAIAMTANDDDVYKLALFMCARGRLVNKAIHFFFQKLHFFPTHNTHIKPSG